jgi:hypothetical protein
MKKIIAPIATLISYLSLAAVAFAAPQDQTRVVIERPKISGQFVGFGTLADFISKTLALAFIIALIAVLIMLIIGAFEWITSGGDKEAVGKARGRIINALVGMAILAVAFALFQLAGQFLGFNVLDFTIPTPAP